MAIAEKKKIMIVFIARKVKRILANSVIILLVA
jgi:hypothetical protein